MAKKEEDITLAEAQAADAQKVAQPKEEAPAKIKYQDGEWKGHPLLKCPHCNHSAPVNIGFSNKDKAIRRAVNDMDKHIEARHPQAWLEGV
jgi:hypothetical protein